MKVLLDMDGVLVDFVGGACRLHGIPDPYADPAMHGVWDFAPVTGLSLAAFSVQMDRDFWNGLDWLPDGFAILRTLVDHFGWDNLWICSAPCDTPGCLDGKRDWIHNHVPALKKRFVFTQTKEVLAHAGALLIDDNDANCEKFRAAGGIAYLVPRVWNSRHATLAYWGPELLGRFLAHFPFGKSTCDTGEC